jgi:hypothetical protein
MMTSATMRTSQETRRPEGRGMIIFAPSYPFWSLLIIALDVVALWALCVYGSRENLGSGLD